MSRQVNVTVCAGVALSVLGTFLTAAAQSSGETHVAAGQGASAAEVVNVRQQGFKKIGAAFKVIHKELSGPAPDAAKVAAAAADIKASTNAIDGWFPVGSGPELGVKTQAKAEIWTDAKGFAATRAAFVRQVEKTTRQLGDPRERAAWKDSSAALGQACKDCHDSYRVKG
jgi:cytochrome c556